LILLILAVSQNINKMGEQVLASLRQIQSGGDRQKLQKSLISGSFKAFADWQRLPLLACSRRRWGPSLGALVGARRIEAPNGADRYRDPKREAQG